MKRWLRQDGYGRSEKSFIFAGSFFLKLQQTNKAKYGETFPQCAMHQYFKHEVSVVVGKLCFANVSCFKKESVAMFSSLFKSAKRTAEYVCPPSYAAGVFIASAPEIKELPEISFC
jgi:hypothetical protein